MDIINIVKHYVECTNISVSSIIQPPGTVTPCPTDFSWQPKMAPPSSLSQAQLQLPNTELKRKLIRKLPPTLYH